MKLPIGLRPSRCQEDFTPLPSQNNDDRTGYDRHCTEIVRLVTLSLPRRKMSKITRLKSGVVATTGETITTLRWREQQRRSQGVPDASEAHNMWDRLAILDEFRQSQAVIF